MNQKMNNEDVHFPCTGCGECCRHINRVEQLAVYDRGDGVCIYLSGNLCSIYKDRPEICRVDYMYEKVSAIICQEKIIMRQILQSAAN